MANIWRETARLSCTYITFIEKTIINIKNKILQPQAEASSEAHQSSSIAAVARLLLMNNETMSKWCIHNYLYYLLSNINVPVGLIINIPISFERYKFQRSLIILYHIDFPFNIFVMGRCCC